MSDGECAIHKLIETVISCTQTTHTRCDHCSTNIRLGRGCGGCRAQTGNSRRNQIFIVHKATQSGAERGVGIAIGFADAVGRDGQRCFLDGQCAIDQTGKVVIARAQGASAWRDDHATCPSASSRLGGCRCSATHTRCGPSFIVYKPSHSGAKSGIGIAISFSGVVGSDCQVRGGYGQSATGVAVPIPQGIG